MGFTTVKIKIFNLVDPGRTEEVEVLVDSGALYSVLSRHLLEKLGINPVRRRRFKVFGGSSVERQIADMGIEYGHDRTVAPVIFGEPADEPLLGVTALESLGYRLNPVTKELEPVDLLML